MGEEIFKLTKKRLPCVIKLPHDFKLEISGKKLCNRGTLDNLIIAWIITSSPVNLKTVVSGVYVTFKKSQQAIPTYPAEVTAAELTWIEKQSSLAGRRRGRQRGRLAEERRHVGGRGRQGGGGGPEVHRGGGGRLRAAQSGRRTPGQTMTGRLTPAEGQRRGI